VARVDLKADRHARVLRVPGVHLEEGYAAEVVAPELAAALYRLAGWLDLDGVATPVGGDLAGPLSRALPA
jgi:hypothetical protein